MPSCSRFLSPSSDGVNNKIGQLVGDQAVDFFRHGAVEGAQSRLDVAHLDQKLRADQGGRDGRVDVAVNQHQVGLAFQHDRLEAGHDVRGLTGMASRPHAQVDVWRGNLELLEEHVRHVGVVVLAGMDQGLLYLGVLLERAQHGRNFHEIRPGTHYVKNMHAKSPELECTIAQICVNCRW